MSDITKKIYSIEPASGPAKGDVIRPVGVETPPPTLRPTPPEDVPAFVTRKADPVRQRDTTFESEELGTRWVLWMGIGFASIWIVGAVLLFAGQILAQDSGLLDVTGLVVLLLLPVILLGLFCAALRRLIAIANQSARISAAANLLVSPEVEALERTRTLSDGIRAEITKVNAQLSDTVTALQGVQIAVTRESQALDAAGLQLTSRSEDVGRNLTLQRQALDSISGTFDAKMETLSVQIAETGRDLETTSEAASLKLVAATQSLVEASKAVSETTSTADETLSARSAQIENARKALEVSGKLLSDNLSTSGDTLERTDEALQARLRKLNDINAAVQEKLDGLSETVTSGRSMLEDVENQTEARTRDVRAFYDTLNTQLKQSEDDTLASQGRTARMVESNLAQMRRDFGRMEMELQTLQTRLNNLRETTEDLPLVPPPGARLSLQPLDSDFPPVEPAPAPATFEPEDSGLEDEPLNLGADMQLASEDKALTEFDPDVLRRPGQDMAVKTGFGRTRNKSEGGTAWRWRDMLGGLERPDYPAEQNVETAESVSEPSLIDRLDALHLSPSAIIDDGTIIDAVQARINSGEVGLARKVSEKLADPVAHLRSKMDEDASLAAEVSRFADSFAGQVGATPPTVAALRALLGSADGRAYLICAAALAH